MNCLKDKILNNKKIVLIITAIVYVVTMAVSFMMAKKAYEPVQCLTADWSSDYIAYNGGWYADEEILPTETELDLVYGPFIHLDKGNYTIHIWYECDRNQTFAISAGDGNSAYIKAEKGNLDSHYNYITYDFSLSEPIDNFETRVQYDGIGKLLISDILIEPNGNSAKKAMIFITLFMGLFCLYTFFTTKYENNKGVVWGIIGISLMASLPVFAKGINLGHDLEFHLMRIESIAKDLGQNGFPIRITSAWVGGYGYPVSVFYGDILLYIPAILRRCGFTILESYKAYIVLINLLTAVITYICMKAVCKKNNLALVTTFVYCTSVYRLINIYIRGAVGEYSAMAFLPLIAYALVRIYSDKNDNRNCIIKNALILAAGMSGLLATHVLSVEMVVLVLILVCIIWVPLTIKKEVLLTYVIGAVATLLINLGFIIPFIDYYVNVPIHTTDLAARYPQNRIQSIGAYLLQYFSFGQNPYGANSLNVGDRMSLTPGIVLIAALLISICLWINKKDNKTTRRLTILALIVLWMGTDLFPWNHIENMIKGGNLLTQIQFPWRYISIATVILTLLLGYGLSILCESADGIKESYGSVTVLVVAALIVMTFAGQYADGARIINYRDTIDLNTFEAVMGAEYVPASTDEDNLKSLPMDVWSADAEDCSLITRKGTTMEIYCSAGDNSAIVNVPMFNYKGYKAFDTSGSELDILNGDNGEIAVSIPSGYVGNVSVRFVSPVYWRFAEAISYISIIAAVAVWIYVKKKTSDGNDAEE